MTVGPIAQPDTLRGESRPQGGEGGQTVIATIGLTPSFLDAPPVVHLALRGG